MKTYRKILNPDILKKLQRLSFNYKRDMLLGKKGEHLIHKKGTSLDFKDYKEYTLGDDYRYIDWNIYARLNKLYVKMYKEEVVYYIHLLLDASYSMKLHEEKFQYAVDIITVLSYIALLNNNQVEIATFKNSCLKFCPSKNNIFQIVTFLEEEGKKISPKDRTEFENNFFKYLQKNKKKRGIVIIISDFLTLHQAYLKALDIFRIQNFEVKAVHIIGAKEYMPPIQAKIIKIVDAETGVEKPILFDNERYKTGFKRHTEELKRLCEVKGINYLEAKTDQKVEDFILDSITKLGLIRA